MIDALCFLRLLKERQKRQHAPYKKKRLFFEPYLITYFVLLFDHNHKEMLHFVNLFYCLGLLVSLSAKFVNAQSTSNVACFPSGSFLNSTEGANLCILASVSDDSTTTTFTLFSNASGWLGFGASVHGMDGADVVIAWKNSSGSVLVKPHSTIEYDIVANEKSIKNYILHNIPTDEKQNYIYRCLDPSSY